MDKELEKARKIFLSDDLDEETLADNEAKLAEWEEVIRENQSFSAWQDHDISKRIVEKLKESYKEFGLRLATNRGLTEAERQSLWTKQDACLFLIDLIDKDAKGVLQRVDEEIKRAINVT